MALWTCKFFSVWKFLCAIYTFSFIQVLKTISPLFIESIALKPWTPVYNVNWHNKFKEQLAITTHTKRKRAAQLRFQYWQWADAHTHTHTHTHTKWLCIFNSNISHVLFLHQLLIKWSPIILKGPGHLSPSPLTDPRHFYLLAAFFVCV